MKLGVNNQLSVKSSSISTHLRGKGLLQTTMRMSALAFLAAVPSLAVGLALPSLPRRRVSLRAGKPIMANAAVDELLRLVREEDKDKAKIISLSETP